MANRTYLTCTNSPSKYQDLNGNEVSCVANYMVPIFWYMLFEKNDISATSTPCDDEPDFKYKWLLTDKDKGIELAKSRIACLASVMGESIIEPFNTFIMYLDSLNGTKIVVDTCELVMMDEKPAIYTKEAKKCVAAFSQPATVEKGFFKKKNQANPNWTALLNQAEIDDITSMPSVDKLCGYSWENTVPWE